MENSTIEIIFIHTHKQVNYINEWKGGDGCAVMRAQASSSPHVVRCEDE